MEGRNYAERIGQNEAKLRRVNEGLEPPDAAPDEPVTFVCECGQLGCTETLVLTRGQYAAVRTAFERFILVPGHEDPRLERVVEDHEAFIVVAKHGTAAEAASGDPSDPRDDAVRER